MTMTHYTPGPYIIEDREHPMPGEYWATLKTQGGIWIADVYAVDDEVSPEQAKANALLLAESPELNSALAQLVRMIEEDETIIMHDLMHARRALAHVRGECYLEAGRPCEVHTALGTGRIQ